MSAAHAYLDAASASLALQALVGIGAAYIVTGKSYIRRIKALFKGNKKSDVETPGKDD
ncbi:hypothetical protein [Novosphingobium sp. PY1]|nr:hypothetical protein [Novosphingobium sp. PY1]